MTPENTDPLSAEHLLTLAQASGIAEEIIAARGYRTVHTRAQLERLGFGRTQRNVPTLLVPIWGVSGEVALYHHRPDQPRVKDGKPVKYEFPSGARMALDVHPSLKDKVRDPAVPLFLTEGVKKADAAISHGLCCIAVVGTWNWRGTNEQGGKTVLPDWDAIALKDKHDHGRQVYICYDSDVMLKPPVYQALVRLSQFLKSRGAKVAYIYLPSGEGGLKQGLDDYLASAGRTKDDLLALATPELRKPPVEETGTAEAQDAASRVLWDNEPERITRPLALLAGGQAVALVGLPVALPDEDGEGTRSVDRLHLVTSGRVLLSVPDAQARGWQLDVGEANPARWSKAGVRAFLSGHAPDGAVLLGEFTDTFAYYIAFEAVPPLTEQSMARLLALVALASYFTPAFPAIGYTHFIGGKGSGKSKAQELHASLSFNGVWVIATTTTAAIRRVAASGGLIAIDDTENLNPRDDPERYSLLLSGYRAGATFQLVEDDGHGGKRVRSIPVFGMRTFSSIKEMDDTLRSRCIPLPLVRSTGPQANRSPGVGHVPGRPSSVLCDDALAFALPRLHEAAILYGRLATKSVLSGRDFDVTGPLLTVAYLIGGLPLYMETLSTVRALLALREEQGEEAREAPVLRALLRLLGDVQTPMELSAQTVADWIGENDPENAHYTDKDGNERSRYSAWTVGRLLRQLQVGQSRRDGKGRWTRVEPALLRRRADAFGGRAHLLRESVEETSQTAATTQTTPAAEPGKGSMAGCVTSDVGDVDDIGDVCLEGVGRGVVRTSGNGHAPPCVAETNLDRYRAAMPPVYVGGVPHPLPQSGANEKV